MRFRRPSRGPSPDWREGSVGVRVLVINGDPALIWADERILEREGLVVLGCCGPDGPRDLSHFGGSCPLLGSGGCPLAASADVIVFGLDLAGPMARRLLAAYRAAYPEKPLCVEAPDPEARALRTLLQGCSLVPFPASRRGLTRTVVGALEKLRGRDARRDSNPEPSDP